MLFICFLLKPSKGTQIANIKTESNHNNLFVLFPEGNCKQSHRVSLTRALSHRLSFEFDQWSVFFGEINQSEGFLQCFRQSVTVMHKLNPFVNQILAAVASKTRKKLEKLGEKLWQDSLKFNKI